MFFTFPENARWDAAGQAVEFGVEIGEYQGVVRVPRRVFQRLLPESPTPNVVLRPITYSGHGSRPSPSGSSDCASSLMMAMSRSRAEIYARSAWRYRASGIDAFRIRSGREVTPRAY